MTKSRNKQISYFRFDTKLARKLDTRITRAGYQNRSDFFTAVAYIALYGDNAQNQAQTQGETHTLEKLPEPITGWIKRTLPNLSEEEIRKELHAVIRDMLFPVLAMKGIDIAFENTWEDVRLAFHDKTGIWATESDIREAYTSFEIINKCRLDQYREEQLGREDD